MPATDSFTSTSTAVAAPSATLTVNVMMSDAPNAAHVEYSRKGFRVASYQNRVQITKASTFGGSQSSLSLPLSLDDARDLAEVLRRVTT